MENRADLRGPLSRRQLMALGLGASAYAAAVPGETHQATGCKVGEMTPESARFWIRRTAASQRLANGILRKGHQKEAHLLDPAVRIDTLEGSVPGALGYVRVLYRGPKAGATPWMELNEAAGYTVQTTVAGLRPDTAYTYSIETRATRNGRTDGELAGTFRTLPAEGAVAPAQIALLSCQMYCHMDRADGFHIYESILRDRPHFLLSCGDNVYYDNEDPIANSAAVAHYHWQRMYSLPTLVECLRQVGGYWQKDDHDVLSDDAWPSMDPKKVAPFTFTEGQRIFREQVPAPLPGKPMYRTVRAGADVELWLPDSRDYRSPNNSPDGPEKSIWGAEQKRWLLTSLRASNATWKVLVNPNPIVGPDRKNKNDNHANAGFAHESREIREFLKSNFDGNVIAVCGDRHWQYHSVDPETGLHEFGCGAASDEHASGTPGYDAARHQFHRVLGGYVTIDVSREGGVSTLRMRHRDVKGATVHEHRFQRKA
jgi:alkaline phosphatase D